MRWQTRPVSRFTDSRTDKRMCVCMCVCVGGWVGVGGGITKPQLCASKKLWVARWSSISIDGCTRTETATTVPTLRQASASPVRASVGPSAVRNSGKPLTRTGKTGTR